MIKDFSTVYETMKTYIIANQDKITDFNEGAVITTILESVADQFETLYIETNLTFQDKFLELIYSFFEHKRLDASKSFMSVTFKREDTTDLKDDIVIEAGHKIVSANNIVFLTKKEAIIKSGFTSISHIACESEETGSKNNIFIDDPNGANEWIGSLKSKTPTKPKTTIIQENIASGGCDEEDDDSYYNRFLLLMAGFGGSEKKSIQYEVLKIDYIKDCNVYDCDDTAGYFFKVVVVKQDYSDLSVDEFQYLNNIVDDIRAAGVPFLLETATYKEISIKLTFQYNINIDEISYTTLKETIQRRIQYFENNIKISQDVKLNELVLLDDNIVNQEIEVSDDNNKYGYGSVIKVEKNEIVKCLFSLKLEGV